jgi:fibronectin-binding autotransporter adhesin
VVYLDKSLTIHGGYTTTNWIMPDPAAHPTTLDAQGQGRVIYITGYIAPTIEGLRITGGDARWFGSIYWDRIGGGIHVYAATAVLSGNVIYGNTATGGGGLGLYHSPATLSGNTIYGNTATDGGGLGLYYLYYGLAALNGNMISGNTASQQGGGVYFLDSDLTLNDNIISGNSAAYGGGLYLGDSAPTLINTVVADNTATGLGAGIAAYWSSPHLLHTTIARNTGGDGSGIHVLEGAPSSAIFNNTIIVSHTVGITVATGNAATLNATLWHANGTDTGGAGSISTLSDHTGDPAFAPDGYHLTSRSAAIDAGVDAGVTTDIDGDARPWGAGYDIGADELRQRYVYLPIVLKSW